MPEIPKQQPQITESHYRALPESERKAVNDTETAKLVVEILEIFEISEVENITTLFAGATNEIKEILKKYPVKSLNLLDLDIDPNLPDELGKISIKPDIQISLLRGNAFVEIKKIPDNSQNVVTMFGAEFLFENTISLRNLSTLARITPKELLEYHTNTILQQAIRILKPGGIILFTHSNTLIDQFKNNANFEELIECVYRKKY